MIRWIFSDGSARVLFPDWDQLASELVGVLRVEAGRHPDDPKLSELVGDLAVHSHDFRRWWAAHPVGERTWGSKRFHHPVVGDLTIGYEALALPGDPDQTLFIYTAAPGSPSDDALKLLDSWAGAAPRVAPATEDTDLGGVVADETPGNSHC